MGRIVTKEDVYDSIKYFVFRQWPDEKLDKLRVFVEQLFDHNLIAVEPFDEKETSNIRIIYYIGNWPDIIKKYNNQGIDICNSDFDLIEASKKLYSYVVMEKSDINSKTRV